MTEFPEKREEEEVEEETEDNFRPSQPIRDREHLRYTVVEPDKQEEEKEKERKGTLINASARFRKKSYEN